MPKTRSIILILVSVLMILISDLVNANGVLRNGLGPRAMSLGGASLIFSDDPLNAVNSNPASLSYTEDDILQLSLTTAILDAEYTDSANRENNADSTPRLIPDAGYAHRLGNRLTFGASIAPVSALEADWEFPDPAGTLGVTYGLQTHKSSFLVLRSALGLAYEVNPQLSIGASAGLMYNRNRMKLPYVFQSHPVLGGLKVLTNLETDGFGVNGVFGINYRPHDDLEFQLSYTTATSFETTGTLRGSAAPLGITGFTYDADVETGLPQMISAGLNWQVSKPLRTGFQIDWIDWSDAFSDLPVTLTNGDNAVLNGIVGSNRIDDNAPLNWKDQFVYRFGAEYDWSEKLALRAGYSFGESPVQSEFLTPTTAATMKHTLGFGAGYKSGNYNIDFAYQWDLPVSDGVGRSSLLAGEYSNSETDISIHWFSIGVTFSE